MKRLHIIMVALSLLLLVLLAGCCLSHEWEEATCTAPQTCSKCGKTEGEPFPHTWEEATCTAPKTCSICGETEGDTLPHEWEEATCTAPKTCSVCGETEGKALEHTWEDATCTKAKTCSVCGKTSGDALGHDWEWTVVKEANYYDEGEKDGVCLACGATTTESIDCLDIVYYWGEPIWISPTIQVTLDKNDGYYWVDIYSDEVNTDQLLVGLVYGADADEHFGFDCDQLYEWMVHIVNSLDSSWESDGLTYGSMSGYGREWIVYLNDSDDPPGNLGLMVNKQSELEALLDIKVKSREEE